MRKNAIWLLLFVTVLVMGMESVAGQELEQENVELVGQLDFEPLKMHFRGTVAIQDNYLYAAYSEFSEPGGMVVIDISDPTNPIIVTKYIVEDGPINALTISGEYAFMAVDDWSGGVIGLNISDPTAPVSKFVLTNPGGASSVATKENYVIVGTPQGVIVFDIEDPNSFVTNEIYELDDVITTIAIFGDYAYVGTIDSGIRILDISNPASLTEVGSYDGGYVEWITISDTYAYVDDEGGFSILDLNEPASPVIIGASSYESNDYGPPDLVVSGDYAYAARNGVSIVDISDATEPVEVGKYFIQGPDATGIALAGDYIYVTMYLQGLLVFQFQEIEPTPTATQPPPTATATQTSTPTIAPTMTISSSLDATSIAEMTPSPQELTDNNSVILETPTAEASSGSGSGICGTPAILLLPLIVLSAFSKKRRKKTHRI